MLEPVYTHEHFPWTDNFSLSCELPCATIGLKTKRIFLSKEKSLCVKAPLHYYSTKSFLIVERHRPGMRNNWPKQ